MTDPCLSPEEIISITGKVQHAAQLRELQRMGIRAYRRKDAEGSVCVLHVWLAGTPEAGAQSRPMLQSERKRRGQAAQA